LHEVASPAQAHAEATGPLAEKTLTFCRLCYA
jgi:hypothetical protein